MKILSLSYYPTGLEEMHEVLTVNRENVDLEKIKGFNPDLIIEREFNDGKSRFYDLYREFPKTTKVWWMIDAHCDLAWHVTYAKQFDYVFCAQSWFAKLLVKEIKGRLRWLPLCHTQTSQEYGLIYPDALRTRSLSFVGNIRSIHPDRERYVKKLLETIPMFEATTMDYQSTLDYLQEVRWLFNCSLNQDLNFRVFEGLASGCGVITDYLDDIHQIAGLESQLITYSKLDQDDMLLKVKHALDRNPNLSPQWIYKHLLDNRYMEILEMVNTGAQHIYG